PGCQPQTEEEFKASLRSTFGDKVTDDNMHEYIQAYNTAIEQVIQGPNGMAVGETAACDRNVCTVSVPDSDFVIRIWEGGMATYGQFCLDVYDTRRRTPASVNVPRGFSLWSSVTTALGGSTMGRHLDS
ncbi:hypothetical protein FOMPIDRAFT_1121990, partial [Fomitopsis schrenkii]